MEAVGLAASIIALGGVLDQTCSLITMVRQFFSSEDEIQALLDDMFRIRLILNRAEDFQRRLISRSARDAEDVKVLLETCKRCLMEIASHLEDCQKQRLRRLLRLPRKQSTALSWILRKQRVALLHQQLRDTIAACGVYVTMIRADRDLDVHNEAFCVIDGKSLPLGTLPLTSNSIVVAMPKKDESMIEKINLTPQQRELQQRLHFHHTVDFDTAFIADGSMDNRAICRCCCYQISVQELRLLAGWLGSLSFCTVGKDDCQLCLCSCSQHHTATYYCPRWLAFRGLFISLTGSDRWQICLSLPRMVAPDSPLFQCVRTGDHKGIQALISGGTASIADISAPYGYSALTTALLYGQMDVAYFLLRQGAPQIISDGSWTLNPGLIYDHFLSCSLIDLNISASQTMSEYRRFFTTEWRQQTLYLHLQSSMLQDLGFSRLHKAVLKISLEEVGKAASAPIVDLDHVDRLGRTALYWASAIGDEEAMRTLLFIGADPAKADPHGVGPIHVSASSKATACVRMLLEAGVCPHQSDNIGNTALHYASAAGSVSVLALILDATSNPNIGTALGEPSIFYAKFSGEDKTAQLLIDRGASVTIQDKWGYDAILDAVYSDAHDILSIFLGRGLSTQKCLIDGKNILHVAALNSDRRTIELLSAFDFRGIYSESRDQAGYTALDYMRQRRRNEDVWDPFCALLLKVKSDNVDAGTKSLHSSNFDIFYDAEEYHIAI